MAKWFWAIVEQFLLNIFITNIIPEYNDMAKRFWSKLISGVGGDKHVGKKTRQNKTKQTKTK